MTKHSDIPRSARLCRQEDMLMLTRVLCVKRPGPCVPYSLLATPYSLPLRYSENLMRLQAQPPARVIEAIP